jgi:hypothetical protein
MSKIRPSSKATATSKSASKAAPKASVATKVGAMTDKDTQLLLAMISLMEGPPEVSRHSVCILPKPPHHLCLVILDSASSTFIKRPNSFPSTAGLRAFITIYYSCLLFTALRHGSMQPLVVTQ